MLKSLTIKLHQSSILLLLLVSSSLIFQNCQNDDDDFGNDLVGDWRVVYFVEENVQIHKSDNITWPDINEGDITLTFSELDSVGIGVISGRTVTNGYAGQYTLPGKGKIAIERVISTLINEPEWTRFFRLSLAERYEIRNEELYILYNDKKNIIVLERN